MFNLSDNLTIQTSNLTETSLSEQMNLFLNQLEPYFVGIVITVGFAGNFCTFFLFSFNILK
jgi:hypothetical protein